MKKLHKASPCRLIIATGDLRGYKIYWLHFFNFVEFTRLSFIITYLKGITNHA